MHDLRYALRQLVKSPGFTAIAVLSLALGIGGNTVVFSFVNDLVLKPLPFLQPEQLVDIDATAPKWNLRYTGINYADFERWRAHNQTFTAMAHFHGADVNLAANQRSERVSGQRVTHDLADVFGLRPVIGRMFRADEEMHGGPKVALIGHHIWQGWFDRDPEIVGRTILIDAVPYEVIGVLPTSAVVPSRAAFWIPFESKPKQWAGNAIGRLKSGVTIEQASADLLRIHRARIPEAKENEVTAPLIQPLLQRYLGDGRFIAFVLQSAVLVLLLIASANIAGLVLARSLGRVPELGLRAALGASRTQLVRQLLTESLLLALVGGAAGVLLGRWALDGLISLSPDLPAWMRFEMDWRFAVFLCIALALFTVVAGLTPARHVLSRIDVRNVLGPGAQQVTVSGERLLVLRGLVVGEIALALLLLLIASLLGRAFQRVQRIEPGFRTDHVLTYAISLPAAKYRNNATRLAFFDEHLAKLRALPGVESASASTVLPFSGQHLGNFFEPAGGLSGGPDAKSPVVLTRMSFPGYFETMGISLPAGRPFTENDRGDLVIVNETLAQLFWPNENAVGKRIRSRGSEGPWLEVIGVARDVRHYGLEGEIRPGIYLPFYARTESGVSFVVRTKGDPVALAPAVRALLKEQDPTLPVAGLATMEDRISQSLFLRRMYSGMMALFALIAVSMAMTGLYGVVAYVVGRRTREFGIRVALGAQARDLLRLVVHEGMRLAAIGIGLGGGAGVLAGLALSSLLMGVSPFDPIALVGASALLGAIVLLACIVPARRALGVNVVDVLRAE